MNFLTLVNKFKTTSYLLQYVACVHNAALIDGNTVETWIVDYTETLLVDAVNIRFKIPYAKLHVNVIEWGVWKGTMSKNSNDVLRPALRKNVVDSSHLIQQIVSGPQPEWSKKFSSE